MVKSWDIGEIRRLVVKPSAYVFVQPLTGVRLSLFSVIVTHEGKIDFEGSVT